VDSLVEIRGPYGMPIVTHKPNTVRQLVKIVDDLRCDRNVTLYELAKRSGLDLNIVTRFFRGYSRLGKTVASDPDRPGRVRLDSALAIVHALGCDLEIVTCESASRPA
jgi:hypothetical protein